MIKTTINSPTKNPRLILKLTNVEPKGFDGTSMPIGKYIEATPEIVGKNKKDKSPIKTMGMAIKNFGSNIEKDTSFA